MSERGSFVTEYIYCERCFEAAKAVLVRREKHHCSQVLDSWQSGYLPIIAGKIGGSYPGNELFDFEFELIPQLEKVICHPMRVAVLGDSGEQIFTAGPEQKVPK